MKLKKNITIIVLFLLIVIVPTLIYLILSTPSSIGIIDHSHIGDFIGYYGAVFGGLLTLTGVWLTIKHQEKQNKEDRAIQYKPIITLVDHSINKDIQSSIRYSNIGFSISWFGEMEDEYPTWYKTKTDNSLQWYFKFKNTGRGETRDARIEKMKINKSNLEWINHNLIHSSHSGQGIGEIISQEEISATMNFPLHLYIKNTHYDKREDLFLDTEITIRYKDMFRINSYSYTLHIRYEVIPQELIENSYNNSDHSVVKVGYKITQIMPIREIISSIEDAGRNGDDNPKGEEIN